MFFPLKRWADGTQVLLKQIYTISLERPEQWCMFLGTKIRGHDTLGVRVDYLRIYTNTWSRQNLLGSSSSIVVRNLG